MSKINPKRLEWLRNLPVKGKKNILKEFNRLMIERPTSRLNENCPWPDYGSIIRLTCKSLCGKLFKENKVNPFACCPCYRLTTKYVRQVAWAIIRFLEEDLKEGKE